MMRRLFFSIPILLVVIAVLLTRRQSLGELSLHPGKNNTVLFLTTEFSGLSNVHVATSYALLENHPSIQVHYASFPGLRGKVSKVSTLARVKTPTAQAIVWHELPGPALTPVFIRPHGGSDKLMTPPGLIGIEKTVRDVGYVLAPWELEDHWNLYQTVKNLVEEIDPAVVVIDTILRPAVEVVVNSNRRVVGISPNALTELFAADQPWGKMFWKYPATSSGFPYPLPWKLIPANIYLQVRMIWGVLSAKRVTALRNFMTDKGVKSPPQYSIGVPGIQWLLTTFPEVNLPLSVPPETTYCGPIVLDVESTTSQDPGLANWLKQAPTMLILLGSLVQYDEERARTMAEAINIVLNTTNIQVLWKFQKVRNYGDEVFNSVLHHIDSGRLRIETWLKPEPISLLQTGDISLVVGHGGGGGFHEAILAGVPQVILPVWFDLYNYAQIVEYLGIGIWPGKDTAPNWISETLAEGFLEALKGNSSRALHDKSKELSKIAMRYGGRNTAAAKLAELAAMGRA